MSKRISAFITVFVCVLLGAPVRAERKPVGLAPFPNRSSTPTDPADFARLRFQGFPETEGLTDVHAIAFDQKGYLWIGTINGPAYYNGRTWTVVALPNRKLSNWVRSMLASSDGAVWFGTESGGLSRLKDGHWTNFTTENGLPDNGVRAILETVAADGTRFLWVGTFGGGLGRLNLSEFESSGTARWDVFNTSNGLPGNYVYKLLETGGPDRKVLSVATSGGLARFEAGNWTSLTSENSPLPGNAVLSLLETREADGSPVLWMGTEKGLVRLHNGVWSLLDMASGLPGNTVLALLETVSPRSRTLWIGVQSGGLVRLENNRLTVFDESSGLPNKLIVSLAQSTSPDGFGQTLWVGNSRSGLSRLHLGGWVVLDRNSGLPNNQVYRFLESRKPDGTSAWWFATYGGLSRLEGGKWTTFDTSNSPLETNIIETLLETTSPDGAAALWVGTFQSNYGGLYKIERNRWTLFNKNNGLPDTRVTRLLETVSETGNRVLWVATYGGGVGRFENNRWTTLDTRNGLPDNRTQALLETTDEDGGRSLWIGTFNGLVRLRNGKTTTYDVASGLPNNGVLDMAVARGPDGKQVLWTATNGGGVARLDFESPNPAWTVFSETSDPPVAHNIVFQVRVDADGRPYFATNLGVTRFTPRAPTPDRPAEFDSRSFSTEDGLPSTICNFGASMVDSQGRIWVGTNDGAAVFDVSRAVEDRSPKPLRLEQSLVFPTGRRIADGDRLPHSDNNLRFEFALLSFFRESRTAYRTQLVGFEERPSDWAPDHKKEYTNLGAGRYVFRVWAKNHDGIVSGPTEFRFSIDAAPWRTWWAVAGYASVLALLGYAVVGLRLKALNRRNLLLEGKIAERTVELAEIIARLKDSERRALAASQAKSTFLANMSHELRTPLNAILGFSQLMEREPGRPAPDLDKIGIIIRSGEHLLGLIDDVLSIAKIEAGKVTLSVAPFKLKRLLRTIEDMFRFRAESKHLAFRVEIDGDIPEFVLGDEGKLRQILINLIGNAFKFTTVGHVLVRVRVDGDEYRFAVEDTGCGISSEEFPKLFQPFGQTESGRKANEGTGLGLAISQEYVRMMGGVIEVESRVGLGTVFQFTIHPPTAPESAGADRIRPVVGLAPDQPGYRILVVDDQPENRTLLEALLVSAGFDVQTAANGLDALVEWRRRRHHLIWMDMSMPDIDGLETTRRIRREIAQAPDEVWPKPVVIAVTANVFESDREAILAAGCDDFVSKPYRDAVIFDKIAEHLGVLYRYRESRGEASPEAVQPESLERPLTPERFASLPPDWVRTLRQSLDIGDGDAANAVADRIAEVDQGLGIEIKKFIKNYRFDDILDVIAKV